jgi:hypothetical protein
VQDEDVQSAVSSHVTKDEQALSSTAVGEILPYNVYTTIDWLHDLVRLIYLVGRPRSLTESRSKVPFVSKTSVPEMVSDTVSLQLLTLAKDGLPQLSLAP